MSVTAALDGAAGKPRALADLETPCLLVERSRLEANLDRMQAHADGQGVALRPHIKTHKSVWVAQQQLARGARGITVAKPGEAEVFVDGGVKDVRLAYPVIGQDKHARLLRLMDRARITFCVDTVAGARHASEFYARAGRVADVLLKVDSGYGRAGVRWDDPAALALAQEIRALEGLRMIGVLTHAGQSYHGPEAEGETEAQALARYAADERDRTLQLVKRLADGGGIDPGARASFEVSIGSTPTALAFEARTLDGFRVTELRPGTYVYYDLTQAALGACELGHCALSALATVVSRQRDDEGERAILDAGKKVLTAEKRHGATAHGLVLAGGASLEPIDGATVFSLSEEHGWVRLAPGTELSVGDRVRVIPNHVCVVVNLQDRVWLVDGDEVVREVPVDARGRVQ